MAQCLSLWQPWGSLIVCGAKKIETRSWPPPFRATCGRLLIHASKRFAGEQLLFCLEPVVMQALATAGFERTSQLPLGAIIGDCRVARSYRFDGTRPPGAEATFGDYTHGRYGWVLEDARTLKTPIPFRGMQGVFEVPDAALTGAEWLPAGSPAPSLPTHPNGPHSAEGCRVGDRLDIALLTATAAQKLPRPGFIKADY